MPSYVARVLKRHAIGVDELKIREARLEFVGRLDRQRRRVGQPTRQSLEPGPAPRDHVGRRSIRLEERRLAVLVERQELGEPLRQPRVAAAATDAWLATSACASERRARLQPWQSTR